MEISVIKTGKLIGGLGSGVNQIRPHKNKWAWELYKKSLANHWTPESVSMSKDIEQWNSKTDLSEDERLLLLRCLGFFAGSESLVSNNLLMVIFKYIDDPEARQYIIRQAAEEAVHNHTVVYVCDSLGLDEREVYEAYARIPAIKAKDDFLMALTNKVAHPDFKPVGDEGLREILKMLIIYYLVCEGTFFYSGFAMLLNFAKRGKMPGLSAQVQYTLVDEGMHVEFGTKLINEVIKQNPQIWTEEFKEEVISYITQTVELESQYADDVLPNGVLGLRADMFYGYVQYIANRRLSSIGLREVYKGARNPFPWMTEVIDLPSQSNFFERQVTNYSVGNLTDDL